MSLVVFLIALATAANELLAGLNTDTALVKLPACLCRRVSACSPHGPARSPVALRRWLASWLSLAW
jgi:hypothetical protein